MSQQSPDQHAVTSDPTQPLEPASGPARTADLMCRESTPIGDRCRRIAVADGWCIFHLRHHRTAVLVDPLELADWTSAVAALRAMDADFSGGSTDEQLERGTEAHP